jgi:serine/threonine protein kinase
MITHEHALESGTVIHGYIISKVLGVGGFGITYLAKDSKLGMEVVIKEYFPGELAERKDDSTIVSKSSNTERDFKKGMQRFAEEAKTLAKFNHPSIVKILTYFESNNTAYFVMEYEEGIDLSQYLKQKNKPLSQEEILSIMMPILEGLKEVHKHNYLHRDIKPGNILLRKNKAPILIDFGASKMIIGEATKSITSMLTEGYAPLEQYSTDSKKQGPFTDIYAIAAVMYKMITGKVPPSAQTRSYGVLSDSKDPHKPLLSLGLFEYNINFLKAIDMALLINGKDRPQNVQQFQGYLLREKVLQQNVKEKKDTQKEFISEKPIPKKDKPVAAFTHRSRQNEVPQTNAKEYHHLSSPPKMSFTKIIIFMLIASYGIGYFVKKSVGPHIVDNVYMSDEELTDKLLMEKKKQQVEVQKRIDAARNQVEKAKEEMARIRNKSGLFSTNESKTKSKSEEIERLRREEVQRREKEKEESIEIEMMKKIREKIEQEKRKKRYNRSRRSGSGAALYAKCAGCHGQNGEKRALGKSAVIGGQSAMRIRMQLKSYRAGTRNRHGFGALRRGQVMNMSDTDIRTVANYISGL